MADEYLTEHTFVEFIKSLPTRYATKHDWMTSPLYRTHCPDCGRANHPPAKRHCPDCGKHLLVGKPVYEDLPNPNPPF